MTSQDRLTVASRVFCIAAILGLGLASRDAEVVVSVLIITTAATITVYLSLITPTATVAALTAEAAIAGLVIGLAMPGGAVLFPYLIVLTLVAGISRGVIGVSATVAVQFGAIVVVTTLQPADHLDVYRTLSPWLMTSIGAGFLGAWLQHSGRVPHTDGNAASYEAAHRLLSQLRTVATRLSSGLDPVTMANDMLALVHASLPGSRAGVFLRSGGGVFSALAYSDPPGREELSPDSSAVNQCWSQREPIVVVADQHFLVTLPLRVGSRMVGVIVAHTPAAPLSEAMKRLMRDLDEQSLQLDTALTFEDIRSVATAEERHRLAREIHDGIAQEIASLGYVVDDLLATSEADERQAALGSLREELTRIVGELRLSIFDLRSDVAPTVGLGSALSQYVRQVGSRSTMTVHISLDEAPARLRPETESQLLRIAQEAITNARKHSGAANLWVCCNVQPPFAQLEVRDDGIGLSPGRSDSYGLGVMRERAEGLGGRLEVIDLADIGEETGALVRVTLGEEPAPVRGRRISKVRAG